MNEVRNENGLMSVPWGCPVSQDSVVMTRFDDAPYNREMLMLLQCY